MKCSNTILPVAIAMIICTFLSANAQHRFGVKPRYRRWLDNSISLDLGAGVLFGGRE
jgi:hypothetical protein